MTYKQKRDSLFRQSEELRRELYENYQQAFTGQSQKTELVKKYLEAQQNYFQFFLYIYSPFNHINIDDEMD
jgi:hypothetical protein